MTKTKKVTITLTAEQQEEARRQSKATKQRIVW